MACTGTAFEVQEGSVQQDSWLTSLNGLQIFQEEGLERRASILSPAKPCAVEIQEDVKIKPTFPRDAF